MLVDFLVLLFLVVDLYGWRIVGCVFVSSFIALAVVVTTISTLLRYQTPTRLAQNLAILYSFHNSSTTTTTAKDTEREPPASQSMTVIVTRTVNIASKTFICCQMGFVIIIIYICCCCCRWHCCYCGCFGLGGIFVWYEGSTKTANKIPWQYYDTHMHSSNIQHGGQWIGKVGRM